MTFSIGAYSIYFGILIFICICMLISGYKKGFVLQILDLFACFVSSFIAFYFSEKMAYMIPFLSISFLNRILWFFILYIFSKCIYTLIENMIKKGIHKTKLKKTDQFFGLCTGALKAFCFMILVVIICSLPFFSQGKDFIENTPLNYIGGWLDESGIKSGD